MDRDAKRESRKRGAASRTLATSQDKIVIRTPKFVPINVSRDPGALITEQMSLTQSPLFHRNRSQHLQQQQEAFIDPSIIHQHQDHGYEQEQPITPQQRIGNYSYEPTTNESNRSIVSSRPTPQKSKRKESHSTALGEAGPSSSLNSGKESKQAKRKAPKQQGDTKMQKKKKKTRTGKPQSTKQRSRKSSKSKRKAPEDEDDEDDGHISSNYISGVDDEGDNYSSMDELVLEEESDNEMAQPSLEISRLPTSSSRLTAIDVVIHYLKLQSPNSSSSSTVDNFNQLNQTMLEEILDLNLVNNHYVYQLRDLKSDKQQLRRDILQRRKEVASQMAKLEKLRKDYQSVRTLLAAKWKIANKLEKVKKREEGVVNEANLMEKLNRLNNVLDPHWSLVDKLKALNSKLHDLDKQLNV